MVTQAIAVNGQRVEVHNVNWTLGASDQKSATYFVDVTLADGKKVRVSKTYELRPAKGDSTFGYELKMVYRYDNQTAQPLVIKTFFNGPTVPAPENIRDIPEVVAGYNDQKQVSLKHHSAASLDPEKDPWDITAQEKLPLVWSGWTSAYFDSIVKPQDAKQSFPKATAKALAKRSE